jgi:hypothetical protein
MILTMQILRFSIHTMFQTQINEITSMPALVKEVLNLLPDRVNRMLTESISCSGPGGKDAPQFQ